MKTSSYLSGAKIQFENVCQKYSNECVLYLIMSVWDPWATGLNDVRKKLREASIWPYGVENMALDGVVTLGLIKSKEQSSVFFFQSKLTPKKV